MAQGGGVSGLFARWFGTNSNEPAPDAASSQRIAQADLPVQAAASAAPSSQHSNGVSNGAANGAPLIQVVPDLGTKLAQSTAQQVAKPAARHFKIDPVSKTVVLPDGTSLENAEIIGSSVVLRQPDGSIFVIDNAITGSGGLSKIAAIVIGGATIPSSTLATALGLSPSDVAAGDTATGSDGSGGDLAMPLGGIGQAPDLSPLLPPTALNFPQPELRELLPPVERPDNPVNVTAVSLLAPEEAASERGLDGSETQSAGTEAPTDKETSSVGTITIDAPDGIGSVVINGVTVTGVGQKIDGQYGYVEIVAYDPATGVIEYKYTVTEAVPHPNATTGYDETDTITDQFTVSVTDSNGDTAETTFDVAIIDDVPTAYANTNSVSEGAKVSGNVLTDSTDDVFGADGAAAGGGVTGVKTGSDTSSPAVGGLGGAGIVGQYGTLILNADGSYTYNADPDKITTGDVVDHFVYTITDGDGDTSTTTLDITVNNVSVTASDMDALVDEKGLATGSSPLDGSQIFNGTITPSGGTGPYTYELTSTGSGTYGTLVLNPNGSYTYTLGTTYDGATNDNGITTEQDKDSFTYKVTDANGNTTTGTILVDIIDDVPTAVADTGGGIIEGSTLNVLAASGVLSNDTFGADGATIQGVRAANGNTTSDVTGGVNSAIAGDYGTLTLAADGSYTYVSNPNAITGAAQDVFVYTLVDGDGDTSTTTLTININDSGLATPNYAVTVNEAALDLTKDAGDLVVGTVTGSLGTSSGAETNGGTAEASGGTSPYTYALETGGNNVTAGTYGSIQLKNDGTYTYTLADNYLNPTANNGVQTLNGVETFTYVATDAYGNTVEGTLTINIIDDVPTANDDADSVTEDGPLVADGNVLAGPPSGTDTNSTDGVKDTQGADGATVTAVSFGATSGTVGSGLAGLYGTLTLNTDGTYSYALNNSHGAVQGLSNGQTLTETFTYTLTDGDGDQDTATLTITINGADDGVTITGLGGDAEETVYEKNLLDGSAPDSAALTQIGDFTVAAPDGLATVVINGVTVISGNALTGTVTVDTPLGLLTITGFAPTTVDGVVTGGTVSYSYLLQDNTLAHTQSGPDGNVFDNFTVVVTDDDGSSSNAALNVDIIDDVPTAVADTGGGIIEGSTLNVPAASGVLSNDMFGADGATIQGVRAANGNTTSDVTGGVNSAIAGDYGTLTLAADGSYTYVSNPNAITGAAQDVFVYTLVDGDGDTSTTTLMININDSGLATPNYAVTVNEAALDLTKDAGDLVVGTVTGSLGTTSGAETNGGTAVASGGTSPYTYALETGGNNVTAGTYGSIQLKSDGTYTYTLADNHLNPTSNDGVQTLNGVETFTYVATDANGNTTTGTLTINIIDDVPTAGTNATVQLDDDALTGGNSGGTGDVSPDTANTSGTLTHSYGADGGSISYLTTGAPSGFQYISGSNNSLLIQQEQGTGNWVTVVTLTLDAATGAYTVMQNDNILHTAGLNENDQSFTINYRVTDGDGDTADGSLTVNVDDDTPVANNYTGAAFAEGSGAHTIGSATAVLGISAGADGLHGTLQQIVFANQGSTGGTLTIDGSGNLVYTSPSHVTSASTVTETFSYTVTDKDGDSVTKTVTFQVTDTGITNLSATNSLADEDNITGAGGNAGGPGDDAQTLTGTISYTLGKDALSSVVLSTSGNTTPLQTLSGATVNTFWDSTSKTLIGYTGATLPNAVGYSSANTVFTIALGVLGASSTDYTVTLFQPVKHPGHDDLATTGTTETAFEDNLGITVNVAVSDVDGSSANTSFTVTIDDDTPTYSGASDGAIGNIIGQVEGIISGSFGADGPGGILLTALNTPPGVTLSAPAATVDGGMQMIATTTDGVTTTTFYTMTWYQDGHYVFDLVTPRPVTTIGSLIPNSANGNFTSIVTPAGVTFDGLQFNEATHAITNPNNSSDSLNVSTGGFGIGGNLIGNPTPDTNNDGFRATFASDVQKFGFDVDFQSGVSTATIRWQAYNDGVAVNSVQILPVSGSSGSIVSVLLDPGTSFDRIEIEFVTVSQNDLRVQNFTLKQFILPSDTTVSFGVTYTDADGDQIIGSTVTDSQVINILLAGNTTTTFNGDSGNDWFTGTSAGETFNGNGGSDTVDYSGSNAAVSINLGADTASGGHAAGDNLNGISNIFGSIYVDTITGDANANTIEGGGGADILDGSGGIDTVSYAHSAAGVTVNLDIVGPSPQVSAGDASGDKLSGFENLTGSQFGDTLTGDGSANTLTGLGGIDSLFGGGGSDALLGGAGNDILTGGTASDTLTGGTGGDTFVLDADVLSNPALADHITDYVLGQGDVLDLSDLLAALGTGAPTTATQANDVVSLQLNGDGTTSVLVDNNGTQTDGTSEVVAILDGNHTSTGVAILFDDTHPSTNVT